MWAGEGAQGEGSSSSKLASSSSTTTGAGSPLTSQYQAGKTRVEEEEG